MGADGQPRRNFRSIARPPVGATPRRSTWNGRLRLNAARPRSTPPRSCFERTHRGSRESPSLLASTSMKGALSRPLSTRHRGTGGPMRRCGQFEVTGPALPLRAMKGGLWMPRASSTSLACPLPHRLRSTGPSSAEPSVLTPSFDASSLTSRAGVSACPAAVARQTRVGSSCTGELLPDAAHDSTSARLLPHASEQAATEHHASLSDNHSANWCLARTAECPPARCLARTAECAPAIELHVRAASAGV